MVRKAQGFSPTKDRLLEAAERLMLAKGFTATTVEEVCGAAKVTKGSFFHYFKSKEQLGKELVERFCASGEERHRTLFGAERDPRKRINAYLEGMIRLVTDPVMSRGCLLGTFAQELCDTHPKIRMACAKGFESWGERLRKELSSAKARWVPRAAFDPQELAEHIIAVVEGALILGKARGDMRVAARSLRHLHVYIRTLLTP